MPYPRAIGTKIRALGMTLETRRHQEARYLRGGQDLASKRTENHETLGSYPEFQAYLGSSETKVQVRGLSLHHFTAVNLYGRR
jgi:hypothetical protein